MSFLGKWSPLVFGSIGGLSVCFYQYLKFRENCKKVQEISPIIEVAKSNEIEWEYNWDKRDPSLAKPPLKGKEWDKKDLDAKFSRHIILIRHGQYKNGYTESQRILTKLGREQAMLTGKRLAELKLPVTEIVFSTMSRAYETGKIILKQLPESNINFREDSMLVEGAPIQPKPAIDGDYWHPEPYVRTYRYILFNYHKKNRSSDSF